MKISLISALDKNNLIGANGGLPWRLRDDMRWYRRNTLGKPIVMGRVSFDGLGRKPLKKRHNIVMTRQADFEAVEGVSVVSTMEEALAAAGDVEEVMINGGAYIYDLFLPTADRFYLTRVDGEFEGDTWFPEFSAAEWQTTFHEHHPADERHAVPFDFFILDRLKA